MKKLYRMGFFLIMAAILGTPALGAEEGSKDLPWERFSLSLVGFITSFNTSVTLWEQPAAPDRPQLL